MLKKLLFGASAAVVAVASVPMFAAFEAHVINVTARIENALTVPIKEIRYGTVFPQEALDRNFDISLSRSFLDETRVDDVKYIIRQKPKCAATSEDGQTWYEQIPTATGHVVVDATGAVTIDCGPIPPNMPQGAIWGPLPSLCPYLSKHKADADGQSQEVEVPAFHKPWTIVDGKVVWNEAMGYLSRLANDTVDSWTIDLRVPCFGGYCAQDWEKFVKGNNPDADPSAYTQPIGNEHKIFGCDLWIEVTGVSLTPPPQGTPSGG